VFPTIAHYKEKEVLKFSEEISTFPKLNDFIRQKLNIKEMDSVVHSDYENYILKLWHNEPIEEERDFENRKMRILVFGL